MPKVSPCGEHNPHKITAVGVPTARGYRGGGVSPPNRLLSFIPERNKIDVTKSENSSIENFPFRDVYFVMRSAKQKTDKIFHARNGEATFRVGKICSFSHLSWSNTQPFRHAKHAKNIGLVIHLAVFQLGFLLPSKTYPSCLIYEN